METLHTHTHTHYKQEVKEGCNTNFVKNVKIDDYKNLVKGDEFL